MPQAKVAAQNGGHNREDLMNRRTVVSALALGVALTGWAGFAGAADVKTVRIAYSVDVLDDTQNAVLKGVQARVDEINATSKDVHVELDVYDAQSSVDKQISD